MVTYEQLLIRDLIWALLKGSFQLQTLRSSLLATGVQFCTVADVPTFQMYQAQEARNDQF